jgi:acyl-CoA thioesterase FadM
MPFDRIEVAVGLKGLHRRGVTLHFEYYRVAEDGQRTKLAVGEHEAIWTDAATGVPGELPSLVLSHLTGRIPVAA